MRNKFILISFLSTLIFFLIISSVFFHFDNSKYNFVYEDNNYAPKNFKQYGPDQSNRFITSSARSISINNHNDFAYTGEANGLTSGYTINSVNNYKFYNTQFSNLINGYEAPSLPGLNDGSMVSINNSKTIGYITSGYQNDSIENWLPLRICISNNDRNTVDINKQYAFGDRDKYTYGVSDDSALKTIGFESLFSVDVNDKNDFVVGGNSNENLSNDGICSGLTIGQFNNGDGKYNLTSYNSLQKDSVKYTINYTNVAISNDSKYIAYTGDNSAGLSIGTQYDNSSAKGLYYKWSDFPGIGTGDGQIDPNGTFVKFSSDSKALLYITDKGVGVSLNENGQWGTMKNFGPGSSEDNVDSASISSVYDPSLHAPLYHIVYSYWDSSTLTSHVMLGIQKGYGINDYDWKDIYTTSFNSPQISTNNVGTIAIGNDKGIAIGILPLAHIYDDIINYDVLEEHKYKVKNVMIVFNLPFSSLSDDTYIHITVSPINTSNDMVYSLYITKNGNLPANENFSGADQLEVQKMPTNGNSLTLNNIKGKNGISNGYYIIKSYIVDSSGIRNETDKNLYVNFTKDLRGISKKTIIIVSLITGILLLISLLFIIWYIYYFGAADRLFKKVLEKRQKQKLEYKKDIVSKNE